MSYNNGNNGDNSDSMKAITNSEVFLLLRDYVDHRKKLNPGYEMPEKVREAYSYVEMFNSGKNGELCKIFRNMALERKLKTSELALLANLRPTTVEEAIAYIPKLKDWEEPDVDAPRFVSDDELETFLNQISPYNNYISH